MLVIGSNKQSHQLTSFLNKFGAWPKNPQSTSYKLYAFTIQFVFSFGYTVCLTCAVFGSVDFQEATVSIPLSLSCVIICTRIGKFCVNHKAMQKRLNEIHAFELWNHEEEVVIAQRLRDFNKLCVAFTVSIYFCLTSQLIVPLFLSKPTLPLPIWFPLKWKHNRIHFWIVYIYSSLSIVVIGHMVMLLQIFTCYLMFMSTVKFELLGLRFSRLGTPQPPPMTITPHFELNWNSKLKMTIKRVGAKNSMCNTTLLIKCVQCHRKIVS